MDTNAKFGGKFFRSDFLITEKELAVAKDKDHEGILSPGTPKLQGVPGLGKIDRYAVVRIVVWCRPNEKRKQGSDDSGKRREIDPTDSAVRPKAITEHYGGIDSAMSRKFPKCAAPAGLGIFPNASQRLRAGLNNFAPAALGNRRNDSTPETVTYLEQIIVTLSGVAKGIHRGRLLLANNNSDFKKLSSTAAP
jgi:hypothetical protein